jgi:TonB dependent receptor/TonB-dependent Receptor Plug Domain
MLCRESVLSLILFLLFLLLAAAPAFAQTPPPSGASVVLPAVTVTAPAALEAQPTDAASERRISGETLNERPIARPGEMLEAVPGLIVTQHAGEGKANQYFLRGFNLDHGTDLAIWLDGMPINMRSNAHAQGYADINFLIPELVQSMLVRKGPYWAQEGDFASAGTLRLAYADRLEKNVVLGTAGSFGYWRGLAAGTIEAGNGTLTAAGEIVRYDGVWQIPDAARKYNAFLRYSEGNVDNGLAITALAYTNSWHSTDQIAQRAVYGATPGFFVDRFGAIDPSDGGDTQRYSLSMRWSRSDEKSADKIEAYGIYSTLNLYNNFTYFLNDPLNGDQFQQSDKRKIGGLNASHTQFHPLVGFESATTLGLQARYDDIDLSLFNTFRRMPLSTIRQDHVVETSAGLWAENKTSWLPWFRTILGVRGDMYWASDASDLPGGSSDFTAFIPSPKAALIFGPWAATEFYVNAGLGFHSNDVRGIAQGAPLLVRSRGAEVGVRTQGLKGLESALALFLLEFDSELLFQGDAGTTEPSRPSRRIGVEWTNHYRPVSWASFDLDLSYTHVRFTDYSVMGNYIPGSPAFIGSAGVVLGEATGWFGGVFWRCLGARPLIEDGSVFSNPTSLFNARLGYVFQNGLKLQLDGFNILNTQANQIDYFYTSRLPGEPAGGVNDVHFHPVEPLAVRFTVAKAF